MPVSWPHNGQSGDTGYPASNCRTLAHRAFAKVTLPVPRASADSAVERSRVAKGSYAILSRPVPAPVGKGACKLAHAPALQLALHSPRRHLGKAKDAPQTGAELPGGRPGPP